MEDVEEGRWSASGIRPEAAGGLHPGCVFQLPVRKNILRADLHVHSCYSGLNGNLPFLHSLDCYSEPDAVYRCARSRGMDLVTITDHDSIDGCLELLSRYPDADDIFVGEEVSCWWPGSALEIHVAAYGHDENDHRELQRLRTNVHDVLAYLRSRSLLGIVNHPFHFYKGQVPIDRYVELLADAGGLEVRNGTMLAVQNGLVADLVEILRAHALPRASVGGSDTHTLRRVGLTWTSAPGRTPDEFLASLRAGGGQAGGRHGSSVSLAADVYGVVADYWKSLAGRSRHGYSLPRRAFGIGFSAVSLPFQFTPALVSAVQKSSEAARCREYARVLRDQRAPGLIQSRGQRA